LVHGVEHLSRLAIVSFLVFLELGFDGLEGAVHVSEQFEHLGVNLLDGLLVLGVASVAALFCVFASLLFIAVRRSMLPDLILHFVVVVVIIIVLELGAGLRHVVSRGKSGKSACGNQGWEDQGTGKASDLDKAGVETHQKLQRVAGGNGGKSQEFPWYSISVGNCGRNNLLDHLTPITGLGYTRPPN
jgi:hypothetical protein